MGGVRGSATMANKSPEKIANRIKIAETDTQTNTQNSECFGKVQSGGKSEEEYTTK